MNKVYFTEEQINELSKNSYVDKVTSKTITFTKEFKEHFIKECNNGKGPTRIFIESGINPYILGSNRIRDFFTKNKKTKYKNEGSFNDNRGKKKYWSSKEN